MISKEALLQVVYEQKAFSVDNTVQRKIDTALLDCPEVLIITGVRRCGKSILLRQIQSKRAEKDYYINFDDERLLTFSIEDFQKLNELFLEEFGEQHTYYFDEIQNIKGWERFIDRLYSTGNKVFVTGSNANLLSREMGTLMTGRHISIELYPFSFREFMEFKGYNYNKKELYTTAGSTRMHSRFQEYLSQGGFPQYLANRSSNYLKSIYSDIVFRDVIVRYRITSEKQVREMLYYLASNATNPCTYSSIAKNIGMKDSDSIALWIDYVEQTYLVRQVNKYSPKVGIQLRSHKKMYFIDNALASQIGFNISKNIGQWLENAVAIELMRRGNSFYYHNDTSECDFIIRENAHIKQAIQVTASMDSEPARTREIKGIQAAMDAYNLEEGYIITNNETDTIKTENGKTINVLPCWKWML